MITDGSRCHTRWERARSGRDLLVRVKRREGGIQEAVMEEDATLDLGLGEG